MRALSAAELLDVWEAGFAQAPTERALALLAAACPEFSLDALAAIPIGQRDARLLALRQGLWGPLMDVVASCPSCRERIELPLDVRQLLADSQVTNWGELTGSFSELEVTFHVPTSREVRKGALEADAESGQNVIFRQCLLKAEKDGVAVDLDNLPQEVVEGIVSSMAEADPLADIQLDLTCPSCAHRWHAVFDIVSFLWTEIEVWAWRILSDVHTLARAYGWGEREILSLSPTRRQFYLEMVGA